VLGTYDDAGNALGGVAALLQVLGDDGEDAGREGHVEQAVGLGPALLELLEVLVEGVEGLILVVLSRDVCAQVAEVVQLLLDLLGGGLHVGPDATDVLVVVHLGARIADDLNVFGQELVAVLEGN
jgi:hypothetical protein